ncbi:MAG: type III secretion system chaperone SycN [Oceanicoccus sp.]|jgi:type III secretion system chaperone SycN
MPQNIAVQNVTDFINRTFGIANIEIQHEQPFALTFGNDFTLMFDFYQDTTQLSILKQVSDYDTQASLLTLLELCHFDHHHAFTLQPGYLTDNILSICAHIPAEKLTLPELNKYFDTLFTTLDTAITQGVAS